MHFEGPTLFEILIQIESHDSYRWKPGLTQQHMKNEQRGPKISVWYRSLRLAQHYLGSKDLSVIVQTG